VLYAKVLTLICEFFQWAIALVMAYSNCVGTDKTIRIKKIALQTKIPHCKQKSSHCKKKRTANKKESHCKQSTKPLRTHSHRPAVLNGRLIKVLH
jgi:hypothetical protein